MAEAENKPAKHTTEPSTSFTVEHLFKAAFLRTKDRIWSYLLVYILYLLMFFGGCLVAGLVAGLNFLIYTVTQSIPVTVTTSIISGVAALAGFIYLGGWGTLSMIHVLISKEKIGAIEAFKEVRPYVWGYFTLSLLMSLFIFGLFPISIPTLFILMIVWGVFSVFSVFIYLETHEKGLKPLWMSKAMVSSQFWGILGRLLLLYGSLWLAMGILSSVSVLSKENGIISLLYILISLLITPFVISYAYEMYRTMEKPKEIPPQTVWVVLSIIGWVILFFLAYTGGKSLLNLQQKKMQDAIQKQMMQKKIDSI